MIAADTSIGADTRDLVSELVRPPPTAPPVPRAFDGLRIVRMLGRGGTSRVFLADEVELERRVAVKVLDEGSHARWRDEARVIAGLRHPGLVVLHRIGVVEALPYLVYELVPGIPLSAATMPMPAHRVLRIGRDVASALACVHRAGIVHADVKPSNVMLGADVGSASDEESARIIDFGIAHRVDRPPRVRAGTPLYMAPERGIATTAADVYALGLVLVELLGGRADRAALAEVPRGGRGSPWHAPEALIEVIARALDVDPARRPSAHDLARVLDELLAERRRR